MTTKSGKLIISLLFVRALYTTDAAISWTKPDSSGAANGEGTLSIGEDQTIDTTIETYVATGTATVTYALTPAVSPFAVSSTGVLTITSALDFATKETYTLLIEASDGTDTGTATITVTVTDVEEAIEWTKPDSGGAADGDGTLSISEDQAINIPIETYVATGATTVSYALIPTVSPFAVSSTGVLTITAALDFETKETYTLLIEATDGTNTGTATITVTVTAVDESDPVFSAASYSACIADKSPADTTLTTVTATVPDTSKTITYTITSGDDDNDFKIDTDTGLIQVNDAKTLDKATKDSYDLVVTATAAGRTGTTKVSVTVADSCNSGTTVAVVSMMMLIVSLCMTLF